MATKSKKTKTFPASSKAKGKRGRKKGGKKPLNGTRNTRKKTTQKRTTRRKTNLSGLQGVTTTTLLVLSIVTIGLGVGVFFGYRAAKGSQIEGIQKDMQGNEVTRSVSAEDKKVLEDKLKKLNLFELRRLRKYLKDNKNQIDITKLKETDKVYQILKKVELLPASQQAAA
jgi:hypothetical protein